MLEKEKERGEDQEEKANAGLPLFETCDFCSPPPFLLPTPERDHGFCK